MTQNNNADHNLTINDMPISPYDLFKEWFQLASEKELNDPNAMCLATVGDGGRPSARMVLLKNVERDIGFGFYTNAQSRKGMELTANPHAALCIHWKSLRRQVRIEGKIETAGPEKSDAYFATRGRESRIGAWASRQSQPLPDYQTLKNAAAEQQSRFAGQDDIPRPPHWQGFIVRPERIEFWIDGEHRLHQRYLYEKTADKAWTLGMLYP